MLSHEQTWTLLPTHMAEDISNYIQHKEIICQLMWLLKFIHLCQIHDKIAYVKKWCWTGDMSLHKLIVMNNASRQYA